MEIRDKAHNCDNQTCKLLNPCLTELLEYQDLKNRVCKVEELFLNNIRNFNKLSEIPLDLLSWSDRHRVYQLPNREFIQELAKTIKEIDPETIIEIAAGRGIICRHISNILNKEIILTDNYSWWKNIEEKIEYQDVIKMDYNEAIDKFKPDLIIVSWIPYKNCWTEDFRKYSSVKGYIVIGESRGGCTGNINDWDTNWTIKDLDDVEKYGICRSDHSFGQYRDITIRHTSVTYFERP